MKRTPIFRRKPEITIQKMHNLQKYLENLPDLGAKPQVAMRSGDFTLERMETLTAALGHPEQKYASIHVAGTNGKGSVSAFCSAALTAQGYKVGRFTSPHLAGALAGISINDARVEIADLEETFAQMQPHLEVRTDWTQFEVVTALMFAHFARMRVDAAVIEVGLGGRLDATNVLTPLVSVITPIDYDHTSILGSTLAEIAREKAGIIKERVPLVISPQLGEAKGSILRTAESLGAEVIEIGKDVLFARLASSVRGQEFDVWNATEPIVKTRLNIRMLGLLQVENAVTAYAALQAANHRGLTISEDAIRRGFERARWPGRFEIAGEQPPIVLDAAHSPAAAQALRAALDEYFPERPFVMVIGVSADKDLVGVVAPLRERVVQAIATQSPHPRAMQADKLGEKLALLGIKAEAEPDAGRAVKRAMKFVKNDELILVCGSVFLVEAVSLELMHP
jgi:dihydrofolate synthase/folylpolyglutamate synthase